MIVNSATVARDLFERRSTIYSDRYVTLNFLFSQVNSLHADVALPPSFTARGYL